MPEQDTFNKLLTQHTEEEIQRYTDLKQDIQELKEAVQALTATWNQAKGVLSFIKWVLGISGGVATFIIFIKDHFK